MSKTISVAVVSLLTGILLIFGVDLDAETSAAIGENIEAVIGGILVLFGIAMGILRKLTDSPLAEGIRGWFGVKSDADSDQQ